jgi:hypothetical protein
MSDEHRGAMSARARVVEASVLMPGRERNSRTPL